jgi:hypothetical protein
LLAIKKEERDPTEKTHKEQREREVKRNEIA